MSNFGLELALKHEGIAFHRAAVGDRYVLGLLRETGGVLGGGDFRTYSVPGPDHDGDALISALQVLAIMRRTGQKLAELAAGMQRFPRSCST